MVNTQVQQNQVPARPQLADLLSAHAKALSLILSCHHIGTIQAFDPEKQTATVTVNYKKTVFRKEPGSGEYQPQLLDYPVLADCPVIFLGGLDAALTFPVGEGDECLIAFNDRDMDNWFQGSSSSGVATPRLHSFADAIVIVGLRSSVTALQDFDTERALLYKGAAKVGVGKDDKVLIAGNLATPTTLNEQLQQLITQLTTLNGYLQTLVTQTALITVTGVTSGAAVSGPPANAPAIAAIGPQIGSVSTAISNIATALGGFLE